MKYITTNKLRILYKSFLSSDPNPASVDIVNFLLQENTKLKKKLFTQDLDNKKVLDKVRKKLL